MTDEEILKEVAALPEKCTESTNLSCACCSKVGCLMSLFREILPNYHPQPHQGGEYGDISSQLVAKGATFEMKGIAKANNADRKAPEKLISSWLRSASPVASSIVRQVINQGLDDSRCTLVCIIVPQFMDNGLKGTIRTLCSKWCKHVSFWELPDLACAYVAAQKKHLKSAS